jgi:hypothetical protein
MTLKTSQNSASVTDFIAQVEDEQKRKDAQTLLQIFRTVTGDEGSMYGSSIIGFGSYTYTRKDGSTYDWMSTGFSPRKQNLTLYVIPGYDIVKKEMEQLGTYSIGKSCLYIKRLSDINLDILETIIKKGFEEINGKHVDYKEGTRT